MRSDPLCACKKKVLSHFDPRPRGFACEWFNVTGICGKHRAISSIQKERLDRLCEQSENRFGAGSEMSGSIDPRSLFSFVSVPHHGKKRLALG